MLKCGFETKLEIASLFLLDLSSEDLISVITKQLLLLCKLSVGEKSHSAKLDFVSDSKLRFL